MRDEGLDEFVIFLGFFTFTFLFVNIRACKKVAYYKILNMNPSNIGC